MAAMWSNPFTAEEGPNNLDPNGLSPSEADKWSTMGKLSRSPGPRRTGSMADVEGIVWLPPSTYHPRRRTGSSEAYCPALDRVLRSSESSVGGDLGVVGGQRKGELEPEWGVADRRAGWIWI